MEKRLGVILLALIAIVSGGALGDRYIFRLPNHAGYWLVRVEDHVASAPMKPEKLVLIVVDGLRRDKAEGMTSARRLAERGQCRVSDQGDYTVSRPVYSLLSTGIEVDRHGSRNNEQTAPLAAESYWEVARRAGLSVRGSSHLPWWTQLFPRGFDEFRLTPNHERDVFAGKKEEDARFDVDLFHPLYVDEKGHHFGAISPEYAAAVTRADAEINALLDRLDLEHTNVILTADHGHRDAGGHGGEQKELREVLACFAGPGIRHAPPTERRDFDGRLTAPLMSLLTHVAFPANMRAGEDHLDDLWDLVKVDPAFEADRKAAITKFRAENARQIGDWLGTTDPAKQTWSALYEREAGFQWSRIMVVILYAGGLTVYRARNTPKDLLWLLGGFALFWLAHHAVLGDFNYTVVNRKALFVPKAFLVAVLATAALVGLHRGLKSHATLGDRLFSAVLLVMSLHLGHIFVYGWPMGFPLPPPSMRYMPFMLAFAQVVLAAALLLTAIRKRKRDDA